MPRTFALTAYIGHTVTLSFVGMEDSTNQMSFVIDDTGLKSTNGVDTGPPTSGHGRL